jgi:hypothetical protein
MRGAWNTVRNNSVVSTSRAGQLSDFMCGDKKMKRVLWILECITLFFSSRGRAQDRGVGVGVIVGDPTGISAKIWTTSTNALQFALARQTRDQFPGTRVSFCGDYLWHSFDALHTIHRFPVFYGIGGIIASGGGTDPALGVRGVVGIDWLSRQSPLHVFLHIVPVLALAPPTEIGLEARIGGRFFFS